MNKVNKRRQLCPGEKLSIPLIHWFGTNFRNKKNYFGLKKDFLIFFF